MKNQALARNISRWVVAFVCTLFLFGLLVLGIIRMTLFNQDFMINITRQSDYTTTITKEINENIQDLGRGSNIPARILEDVISQDIVQNNVDGFIRSIYTGIPLEIQESEMISDTIKERVVDYANEKNYSIDDAAINRLVTDATNHFEQYIEIPYIATFGNNVTAYSRTLNIMTFFCGAVFIVTLMGTLGLIKHWWHRRLRYISYIFGGAGLMLVVLPGIAYLSGRVNRLSIATESLYRFLTTYVNAFTLTFVKWGFVCLFFAVVLWVASELMRRKTTQKIENIGVTQLLSE